MKPIWITNGALAVFPMRAVYQVRLIGFRVQMAGGEVETLIFRGVMECRN